MAGLREKLERLPRQPGVYYHLDGRGRIIYVGKAADLRHRVRHYFQQSSSAAGDDKAARLRQQIADVKWTVTDNPLQALFLEGEMIKRYQPKYNVREREVLNDSWHYACFNLRPPNPNLQLARTPQDAAGPVLGPYLDGRALKAALRYLRRSFPFSTHKTLPAKACLDYHLGLCPGPEVAGFDRKAAQANLRRLIACLSGRQTRLVGQLQKDMAAHAAGHEYEAAARARDQIAALRDFKQSIIFPDFDRKIRLGQDQALEDLRRLFRLPAALERIEAYDISHISGSFTTAAMVVAHNGVVRPALSRRFKSGLAGNDDFGQIREVLRRRFKSKSLASMRPDLILIDGGRGQVSSVLAVLDELALAIPVIGLAKKREQIVFRSARLRLDAERLARLGGSAAQSANFTTLTLDAGTPLIRLLQRLRDASHRAALAYHNHLQAKGQVTSELLRLPSIGPATYRRLIKRFGSADRLARAGEEELAELLNRRQLAVLLDHLRSRRRGRG